MHKATAVIRKVGNEYCVFSKDGKNLGCSNSREGAEKRLQQVEFFKNKGSKMNYDNALNNFAKSVNEGFTPAEETGDVAKASNLSDRLREGTIAGFKSERLLDSKDHFPVITHTQAQSSMARVMQLAEVPGWYRGTIAELRQDVYEGINRLHPDIELNVRVPAEMAVALSDGETPAETSQTSIKDPEDDRKHDAVPQVARPTLTSAQVEEALADEGNRKAVAGRLMEMVDKQIEHLNTAKKIASRLLKGGMKAEEFDQLSTYVQEDILRELLSRGATASTEGRRRELLDRMKNNG